MPLLFVTSSEFQTGLNPYLGRVVPMTGKRGDLAEAHNASYSFWPEQCTATSLHILLAQTSLIDKCDNGVGKYFLLQRDIANHMAMGRNV